MKLASMPQSPHEGEIAGPSAFQSTPPRSDH